MIEMQQNHGTFWNQLYNKNKEFIITPDNLEIYLKKFSDNKTLYNAKFFEGKRILITGISGFVGSHLAENLIWNIEKCEVHGIVRRHSVPIYPNLRHVINDVKLHEGNLNDYHAINKIIKEIEPELVFHLAAQSFVPSSISSPIETNLTNSNGTINLYECLIRNESQVESLQVACSSEQYGKVLPDEIPISEKNPFRPQSPYAVSKIAEEYYTRTYHDMYGLPGVITRGFNHSGPRRGIQFVTSVICSQIANVLLNGGNKIIIGNPDPIRDFTDIRDMIQGYMLAISKGKPGEIYNLGHGMGISIRNFIKLALKLYNLDSLEIEIDKSRYRPAEVNVLICDYSKANRELGYYPQYPLTETIKSIVEYYIKDDNFTRILSENKS